VSLYSGCHRYQLARYLKRGSTAARLLRLRVRIPPGAWRSVWCVCCVLSGRGLCDGPITRSEDFYRVRCVWPWHQKNAENMGRSTAGKYIYIYILDVPVVYFDSGNSAFWKLIHRDRQTTDNNMAHGLCVLDDKGYRHTIRICHTNCLSTTAMVTRTHLNVTLYRMIKKSLCTWWLQCTRLSCITTWLNLTAWQPTARARGTQNSH
jgi:hypothetical protein